MTGAELTLTLPSQISLTTWRWSIACKRSVNATTGQPAKWRVPGHCAIPLSPEPSLGHVTPGTPRTRQTTFKTSLSRLRREGFLTERTLVCATEHLSHGPGFAPKKLQNRN